MTMEQRLKEEGDNVVIANVKHGTTSMTLINKYEDFIKTEKILDDGSDEESIQEESVYQKAEINIKNDLTDIFSTPDIFNRERSLTEADTPTDDIESLIDSMNQARKFQGESPYNNELSMKDIEKIQEKYSAVLDYIFYLSAKMKQDTSSQRLTTKSDQIELLHEKISFVEKTRNDLISNMDQAREMLDLLDLVERYKLN